MERFQMNCCSEGNDIRVLDGIDICIKAGNLGYKRKIPFEIKLLLEIMANIKPYDGGSVFFLRDDEAQEDNASSCFMPAATPWFTTT